MYNSFFQLSKTPFSLVPDPGCVLLTAQHADAISGMLFGVLDRKGYLVLTGEAGLGKTTVVRTLLQLLAESRIQSSVIFNPTLTPSEFLEMALLNFGFNEVPDSKAQRLKLLEEFLLRGDADGRVSVLIIDEAHQMSPALLEEIRLLGNFDGPAYKLLQIVLVGQNELNERLDLPELWQLKQRVTIRLSLERLDRVAVQEYIAFRWNEAGGPFPHPFSGHALDAIATWSNGIPRLINAICENALLIAFSEGTRVVEAPTVQAACMELKLPTPRIARSLVSKSPETAVPLTTPAAEPELAAEAAADKDGWGAAKPSILKRWLRLSDSQPARVPRSKSRILSLEEPQS